VLRRHGCALSLILACCATALAQPPAPQAAPVARQITLGRSVLPLYGPWKFMPGDSPLDPVTHQPLWSSPSFNDASWESVDLTPPAGSFDPVGGFSGYSPGWTRRGHPGLWGYAWYRIHLRVSAQPGEKLALTGPADVDDIYEIFANGQNIGSFGDFSHARPTVYFTQPMMFPLPETTASGASGLVLALRVWMEPATLMVTPDAAGMHTAPMLGDLATIAAENQMRWLELLRAYAPRPVEATLFLLLAVVAFSLILFDRSDRVYLWMGTAFLLSSITFALTTIGSWTQWMSYVAITRIGDVVVGPLLFAVWIMVWWTWFRLHRPAWLPRAVAVLTAVYMLSTMLAENLFFVPVPFSLASTFQTATLILRILLLILLVWTVIEGIRLQGFEGWLVVPAVIFVCIGRFSAELGVLHIRMIWFPFGIQLTINDLAGFLLVGTLALLLLRRLLQSVRDQRRLALDVKQAQEVQQVILPQPRTEFPGLVVESEYRPALEVGGDFFQIIPNPSDSSLLVVAGDVTGKGLKAGMLVALLVGAIRSTVESTTDPRQILEALNRRLLGRGEAHATCLALRIAADGSVALANAGHMPPYLNGQPVSVDGSLPLGMTLSADFSVLRFHLAAGDRLVVISDGIVEATDTNRSLFGFERTCQLLRKAASAAEIAAAAQSWGQEDDISVISVTRTAVLAPVAA
jgi:hypothetical protein